MVRIMTKALITGASGFVGPYLWKELEEHGYDVTGFDLSGDNNKIIHCDITNADLVYKIISEEKPDVIFHLAGFSSVAKSFGNPDLCMKINVDGTKNLLEAVVKAGLKSKILIISSAEVYGKPKKIPIDENHSLNPLSPYGESRVKQEIIAFSYDLPVIISRSFNHTGEGQPDIFVIPSFKKQVEEAENEGIVYVGNLDVIRDFSDVKDVVKAYRVLVEKGTMGEIYNVGSGNGYKLRDVLDKIIKASGKNLNVKVDTERYRKSDIPELVADNTKIKRLGLTFKVLF